MKTIDVSLTGPLIVREDLRLNGIVVGDVTVPSGRRIELNGEIHGGILICAGPHADIHGVVHGSLHDEGGTYRIGGQVGSIRAPRGHRYV